MSAGDIGSRLGRAAIFGVRVCARRLALRAVRREEALLSVRLAAIDIQDLAADPSPTARASNWDSALTDLIDAAALPERVRASLSRRRVLACAANLADYWLARAPDQRCGESAAQLFADTLSRRPVSSTQAGLLYARALRFASN